MISGVLRLVDQDAVGLVDHREVMAALDRLRAALGPPPLPRNASSKVFRCRSPPAWYFFSSSRRKSKPNSLLVP